MGLIPVLTRIGEWSEPPGARNVASASVKVESQDGLTSAPSNFLEMNLLPDPLLQVRCLPELLRSSRSEDWQQSLNSSILEGQL